MKVLDTDSMPHSASKTNLSAITKNEEDQIILSPSHFFLTLGDITISHNVYSDIFGFRMDGFRMWKTLHFQIFR